MIGCEMTVFLLEKHLKGEDDFNREKSGGPRSDPCSRFGLRILSMKEDPGPQKTMRSERLNVE
jgi:hypothetical protein